jgi:hypothetical protein
MTPFLEPGSLQRWPGPGSPGSKNAGAWRMRRIERMLEQLQLLWDLPHRVLRSEARLARHDTGSKSS